MSGLTLDSRLALHPLVSRQDEDGWIVGRTETGTFVGLPDVAVCFIDAVRDGATVGEAKHAADEAHGGDVDALDFAGSLVALGFVAGVDEADTEAPPTTTERSRRPSLPWLRPVHVAWLFGPTAAVLTAMLIVSGFCLAALRGALPGSSSFFVFSHQGANLLTITAISLAMLVLHEFCHLAAARAAGVDGWFSWGTRLVFLVAQTEVPGLWMAERRSRITVFLAGSASDLLIASGAAAGSALVGPHSLGGRLLAVTSFNGLISVLLQFEFYMRTDVYFVIQDLLRCKNLFEDALAYLRYLADLRLRRRPRSQLRDPRSALPRHERRPVTVYAALVLIGSSVSLGVFAWYGLPVTVELDARSVRELVLGFTGGGVLDALDAGCALLAVTPLQLLLVRTLLRKRLNFRAAD